jgi:hypothetical protein
MFRDRGAPPEAIQLDTKFGMEQFLLLERQLQERLANPQPSRLESPPAVRPSDPYESQPKVESAANVADADADADDGVLRVAQAMVLCRRFGRAAPRGGYWNQLIQRVAELAGSRPANVPKAAELAVMSKMSQRLALRDVLDWADARGVLAAVVGILESVPQDGWLYMEKTD